MFHYYSCFHNKGVYNRLGMKASSQAPNSEKCNFTSLKFFVADMATRYSQKCCEKLVDAGAISTLLKLIRSVSRSIPDQEVLKHSLSTLGNLARYPHLLEVLIDCHGSIETILWELLRSVYELRLIIEVAVIFFHLRMMW